MTQEVLGRFDFPLSSPEDSIDLRTSALGTVQAPVDFSRMYNAAIQMMLEPSSEAWGDEVGTSVRGKRI